MIATGLKRFRNEWRAWQAFKATDRAARRIVFYSESSAYWVHFESIIHHLWRDHQQPVVYLSSDANEPVFNSAPEGVTAFHIGDGTVRTLCFAGFQADVLVMTMPDLHSFHVKRSPHKVHYAYVYHSMASTHMVYRTAAFDHYDTIFCTGPHQVEEIRAREQQQGLARKNIIEHGYARLEALMQAVRNTERVRSRDHASRRLLIAPSWGEHALLERHGGDFIEPLLKAGYHVTLRPHPQTRRFHGELLDAITSKYESWKNFVFEENVASIRSLLDADIMISDWSSAALEFALGLERPVIFVDVPRKVNNPDWRKLEIEPLEARLREKLGIVVAESDLRELANAAENLLARRWSRATELKALRSRWVYNIGESGKVAADALMQIVNRAGARTER